MKSVELAVDYVDQMMEDRSKRIEPKTRERRRLALRTNSAGVLLRIPTPPRFPLLNHDNRFTSKRRKNA